MKRISCFVLSVSLFLFVERIDCDDCVVPPELEGIHLGEDAEPGTELKSFVSSDLYNNVTIGDLASKYLESFEDTERKIWGLRVLKSVSPSVDCVGTDTLNGATNSINSIIKVSCAETGLIGEIFPTVEIDNVNNRIPTFSQETFTLDDVSPSIPPEFSLNQLGYKLSDFYFYDLDHTGPNPTDTSSSFKIEMTPNDLFELIPSDEKRAFDEDVCKDPETLKDIVALDLKLLKAIPANVTVPYVLEIKVTDSNDQSAQGSILINFKQEDRFPPTFTSPLYYASIMSIVFEESMKLDVKPSPIKATDGDEYINAEIGYGILPGECSGSFKIENSGELSWTSNLDQTCVDQGSVRLLIEAFQIGKEDKSTVAPCVVQFQVDTKNPDFENLNTKSTLNLKTGELDPKVMLSATDSDSDDTLIFSLLEGPGSEFFEIVDQSELVTKADFDSSNLPKGNSLNLVVQVQQSSNAERVSTANIEVNYAYNFNGPKFEQDSYYYEPINPKPDSDINKESDINASDSDNLDPPPTIDYQLSQNAYFVLGEEPFSDGSPRIVYKGGAVESDIHILTLEATEKDVFPEQSSKTNIVIQLTIDESISTTGPADTTTSSIPIVDKPTFEKPLYTKDFPSGYKPDPNCIVFKALGSSDDIEYSIQSVEDPQFATLFEIADPTKGTIKCKAPSGISKIDDTILITIRATFVNDPEIAFDDSIVLITVNEGTENEAPTFTSGDFGNTDTQSVGYPTFIFLESFISMPLTRITAIDPNSQDKIKYSIKADTGDQSSKFYIDSELGFIYALPSKATDIKTLCPKDCTFMAQASDGHDKPVEITVKIKPLNKDQVIGMEVKKAGENPATILNTLNNDLKDDEVWLRQIQYQPTSKDDRGLREDQEGLPVLFVSALNKDQVFAGKGVLEGLLGSSDLVDVGYEYTVHSEDAANQGNSEALLIVVIVLAILFASSVIGLVVFFFYFKRKRDAFMRDDSSHEIRDDDEKARPNRFARPDSSPTKDFNKSGSVERDPKAVVYSGTNFSSQKHFDELNDQLKRHLSDDLAKQTKAQVETSSPPRLEPSGNGSPSPAGLSSSSPSTAPKRPAPPPPKAPMAPKRADSLDIAPQPLKLNEDIPSVPKASTPPSEAVHPKLSEVDEPPPLDRRISFNESAEVIRVVAEAKEVPIKEEIENESDGDDDGEEVRL